MMPSTESKRRRASHRAGGSQRAMVDRSSSEARRRAAAVLEVLAGVRTPAQAADALAVSLPRYYLLELRAIGGLVEACEPAPRGPQPSAERRVASLERELSRVKRESDRYQALARATQRALGLSPPAPPRPNGAEKPAASGKPRRRRRPTVRGLRLAKALASAAATGNSSGVSSPADVQQAVPPGK